MSMGLDICFISGIALFIGFLIIWSLSPSNPKNAAEISFKAFKQFYSINPERWKLHDYCVECIIPDKSRYGLFDHTEKFYFNFFDYQKYKKFLNKVEQDKINAKNIQATAEMINAVKQDIANMERLAQRQKKQAVDNLNAILKNL